MITISELSDWFCDTDLILCILEVLLKNYSMWHFSLQEPKVGGAFCYAVLQVLLILNHPSLVSRLAGIIFSDTTDDTGVAGQQELVHLVCSCLCKPIKSYDEDFDLPERHNEWCRVDWNKSVVESYMTMSLNLLEMMLTLFPFVVFVECWR